MLAAFKSLYVNSCPASSTGLASTDGAVDAEASVVRRTAAADAPLPSPAAIGHAPERAANTTS